jgi:hypothetical protein
MPKKFSAEKKIVYEKGGCKMIADAIKKIKDSMEGMDEKRVPAEPISKYLINRMESDEQLAAFFVQEHKTLQKCFDFVYEQVKKHLDSKPGWVEDNDVYLMAVDYIIADDAALEKQKAEDEAKEAEARKVREEQNRILMEERRVKSDSDKAEKDAKKKAEAAKKALEKKQAPGQISLFDDWGADDAEQTDAQAA